MSAATNAAGYDFPLYDWGNGPAQEGEQFPLPTILDTTLRDGVQSLLVRQPSLEEKFELVDKLIELGIEAFDVGFPLSSAGHLRQSKAIAEHAARRKPDLRLTCLARSRVEDVAAIVEVSQAAGVEMEALIFVASSPVRLLVEQWNIGEMIKWATAAIDFAIREGLKVNFACEDATRSEPETLKTLHRAALEHGATRFTIPDTVGICSVASTAHIVRYLRQQIIQGHPVGLDWHGHDDRGLAVANALTAVSAGADCIHTTVLGIGERCGNTPLEPLLANLYYLCGERPTSRQYHLEVLPRLSEYAASIFGEAISPRHPVVGKNAYSTAAGIHGAAILKAWRLGRPELVANAYAGVDPRLTGRKTKVQVGPMSGASNVEWQALQHGIPFSEELASQVLEAARDLDRILTDDEILAIAASVAQRRRCAGREEGG